MKDRGAPIAAKRILVALFLFASACTAGSQPERAASPPTSAATTPEETASTTRSSTAATTSTGRVEPAPPLPFELTEGEVVILAPEVLASIPHPMDVFTQGLEVRDGLFYESAGLYGQSRVRVFGTDGAELRSAANAPELFGEGLTLVGDRMIQITWREQMALVWDIETLKVVDQFSYEGEGWGICFADSRLIMSDGSSRLTFRDPATFEEIGSVEVTLSGRPRDRLNELECIGDFVMANVWQSDLVLIIDPADGAVVGLVDAFRLLFELDDPEGTGVLNGIAYDGETGALYLTGKNWPEIFQVRLVPAELPGVDQ